MMLRSCACCLALLLAMPMCVAQGTDTLAAKRKHFDADLQLMTRGEIRDGGLPRDDVSGDAGDRSSFLLGRARLVLNYAQPMLEARLTAQQTAVWGDANNAAFKVYEAWAKLKTRIGLFAQVGRVALAYDDERIIGPNDWAMAANSHDVIRLGYEGFGHKVHAIFAYNQNTANMINGGTIYVNGSQPYKTMLTGWYHYDLPWFPLGASVLFMNVGLQAGVDVHQPHNEYQQLIGGRLAYTPRRWSAEAAYYRQMGRNEEGVKIDAWMASAKIDGQLSDQFGLTAGYDYLSGDKYFAVPSKSMLGLVRHDVIRGFNPIYGSHHKFYGAMDFFYVSTYLNGFTPGLQNLYFGGSYSPIKPLSFHLTYHYMATATQLDGLNRTLGHEIEVQASYVIAKEAKVSLGFSYMTGTETMERLKRASADGSLRWAWLSLNISPRIVSLNW